ncbi:hypothetical protein C8D92_102245 [Tamilnaduibacter salinus]|uniref:DUF2970 domain-containing protein n=1 Tax=Tamilnaduibacter salinus TaxID=1484056 RepID=A0A2A2I515_9GAMM|nr:DUF2970 domain-containing protein [Tamilnaduibacter salinus]PAV26374.1 hypothetical protein CF392_05920 [Tamilnaduibacter salinus]PVY78205.1 hypothetical protein C8D92_102245 [Tamilnaduibacter salinus]
MTEQQQDNQPQRRRPGILKIIQSILAGAFGVQSNRRREEDFRSGNALPYIIAGVIFTAGFVITIALIVRWVLSTQS